MRGIKRREGQGEREGKLEQGRRKKKKREEEKRKERRKKGYEEGNWNQCCAGSRTGPQRTRNCATRGRFRPTLIILLIGAT